MQKLILIVGETASETGKETWYTDKYVEIQLERLKKG
jgi:hypothetical protein